MKVLLFALLAAISYAQTDWGYPSSNKAWSESSPEAAVCASGRQQSPIDLPGFNYALVRDLLNPEFQSVTTRLQEASHGLKWNIEGAGETTINSNTYNVLQFHAHTGSEHTVNGLRADIEFHFVHNNPAYGYAVIAIMCKVGPSDNLIDFWLELDVSITSDVAINAQSLFASIDMTKYYTYDGSFTTPPCTENVKWIVIANYCTIPKDLFDKFSAFIVMEENYRETQPLYGRTLGGVDKLAHWKYPSDNYMWSIDENGDDICHSGKQQSPINLPAFSKAEDRVEMNPVFSTITAEVQDESHTLEWNIEGIGSTEIDYPYSHEYDVVKFHLHASSEHSVNGNAADMEIHFVHHSEDYGYGVLGVLCNEGDSSIDFWTQLDSSLTHPTSINAESLFASLNMNRYFTYDGSFTTPPCTEGVKWVIIADYCSIPSALLTKLTAQASMHNNYRHIQPLHGREIGGETDRHCHIPEHFSTDCGDILVGTSCDITFNCPDGEFSETVTQTCTLSGDWNGPNLDSNCYVRHCNIPERYSTNCNEILEGSSCDIKFDCTGWYDGYISEAVTQTCTQSGNWEGPDLDPNCRAKVDFVNAWLMWDVESDAVKDDGRAIDKDYFDSHPHNCIDGEIESHSICKSVGGDTRGAKLLLELEHTAMVQIVKLWNWETFDEDRETVMRRIEGAKIWLVNSHDWKDTSPGNRILCNTIDDVDLSDPEIKVECITKRAAIFIIIDTSESDKTNNKDINLVEVEAYAFVHTLSPTTSPSSSPTMLPTPMPTSFPSSYPTSSPTTSPSSDPTSLPSTSPTSSPTSSPSTLPTTSPSTNPTSSPSSNPTSPPSTEPSTQPSTSPTSSPTTSPSTSPSTDPTTSPSTFPTTSPSTFPTSSPTTSPSSSPTDMPSVAPSNNPSIDCSQFDGELNLSQCVSDPSCGWSQHNKQCNNCGDSRDQSSCYQKGCSWVEYIEDDKRIRRCTGTCEETPGMLIVSDFMKTPIDLQNKAECENLCLQQMESEACIYSVYAEPGFCWWFSLTDYLDNRDKANMIYGVPTFTTFQCILNEDQTASPSKMPSTSIPSSSPSTSSPTSSPTTQPSESPSTFPTSSPTTSPSTMPSTAPSTNPTSSPTTHPSTFPSTLPTTAPTSSPSSAPSTMPTTSPTSWPTENPSTSHPTTHPTTCPTSSPSTLPTTNPSTLPTTFPTTNPSTEPTTSPSTNPTSVPTSSPSSSPSTSPSTRPSTCPTTFPSTFPTTSPSTSPTTYPTTEPTSTPTSSPSSSPSTTPTTSPTSQPTTSPVFASSNSVDCIDMQPFCTSGNRPEIGYVATGYTWEESCCAYGGGYVKISETNIDKRKTARIASDLSFGIDFTYSFWCKIIPDNKQKQILQLSAGSPGDEENWDAWEFIKIEDQKIKVSIPLRATERRNLLTEITMFTCETDKLSNENDQFKHHNSIHFSHYAQEKLFSLYLNGKRIDCPYESVYNGTLTNIDVQEYVIGVNNQYGDLIFTRHAFSAQEVDYFTNIHLESFPVVAETALLVIYCSAGLSIFLCVYAIVGWQYRKIDRPDFFALISVGFGVLDITSDWQLTFELFIIDHELWFYSFIFCILPAICGIVYFVYWYRKHTTGEDADILKSWLLQYRVPFFAMMIVSSSNLGFFKILWSRCNGLFKGTYSLFNMPLTHNQQISLMKGKVINVVLEELPLFFIQGYILYSTDASSNDNALDRNSQLAVMIALVSTIIGFSMNAVQYCATRENIGESQMRKQNVLVKRPTRNLNMLGNTIAKNFVEGHYICKVFVWSTNVKKNEYGLQFFHNDANEENLKHKIVDVLEDYIGVDSEVFLIPETRSVKLIENILDLNLCMDTKFGEIQIRTSQDNGCDFLDISYPIKATLAIQEFMDLYQDKVLSIGETFHKDKKYNIEKLREHRSGRFGSTQLSGTLSNSRVSTFRHVSLSNVIGSFPAIAPQMGIGHSTVRRMANTSSDRSMFGTQVALVDSPGSDWFEDIVVEVQKEGENSTIELTERGEEVEEECLEAGCEI